MNASSTTLNIESTAPAEPKPAPVLDSIGRKKNMHSHGSNFGRYVEGCPACIAKYPGGPGSVPVNKQRKRNDTAKGQLERAQAQVAETNAQNAKLAESSAATIRALQEQIDKLRSGEVTPAGAQSKGVDALVELMLRKESRAIQEEELERQRLLESREQMLKVEMERIRQDEARQAVCGHTKENGRTAICNQQVHNDGMVHPFCQRCFKTWPPHVPARA